MNVVNFCILSTIVLLILKVFGILNFSWFVVAIPAILFYIPIFICAFMLGHRLLRHVAKDKRYETVPEKYLRIMEIINRVIEEDADRQKREEPEG